MKKFYSILAAAAMFLAVDANAQLGVGIGYNHLNNEYNLDRFDDEMKDISADINHILEEKKEALTAFE